MVAETIDPVGWQSEHVKRLCCYVFEHGTVHHCLVPDWHQTSQPEGSRGYTCTLRPSPSKINAGFSSSITIFIVTAENTEIKKLIRKLSNMTKRFFFKLSLDGHLFCSWSVFHHYNLSTSATSLPPPPPAPPPKSSNQFSSLVTSGSWITSRRVTQGAAASRKNGKVMLSSLRAAPLSPPHFLFKNFFFVFCTSRPPVTSDVWPKNFLCGAGFVLLVLRFCVCLSKVLYCCFLEPIRPVSRIMTLTCAVFFYLRFE